jgi:hypothetical protein
MPRLSVKKEIKMEVASSEEKTNYHEFQCLSCKIIWLMKEGERPQYCPGCGLQFGEFVTLDKEEFKS